MQPTPESRGEPLPLRGHSQGPGRESRPRERDPDNSGLFSETLKTDGRAVGRSPDYDDSVMPRGSPDPSVPSRLCTSSSSTAAESCHEVSGFQQHTPVIIRSHSLQVPHGSPRRRSRPLRSFPCSSRSLVPGPFLLSSFVSSGRSRSKAEAGRPKRQTFMVSQFRKL